MEIQAWLKDYQAAARPLWQAFFKTHRQEAKKAGPLPNKLLERFIDLYPRGKQARGALAVLGYELAGGRDKPKMLQASITLELMETAVLIADDVFDDDATRRGVPAIHRQWERIFESPRKSPLIPLYERGKVPLFRKEGLGEISTRTLSQKKLGQDLAHTTSIIGFHLAPLATLSAGLPDTPTQKALTFYCQSLVTTGFGEALDISAPALSFQEKQASAQLIHDTKTVRYSTVLPLKFGAILAGAGSTESKGRTLGKRGVKGSDPKQTKQKTWLENLEAYARALGRIFQIQDDIIGSFGDPAKTGKSNESDIRGTRWTILIELLWQRLSSQDKKRLQAIFEKRERSDQDVAQIKRWMKQCQVIKAASQKARVFLRQGLPLIPKITQDSQHRNTMENLLKFMLERES